jgi:hypothetical protein
MRIISATAIFGAALVLVPVSSAAPTDHQTGARLPFIVAQTQPDPSICEWLGHCRGATCSSANDCSDVLVCVNGRCDDEATASFEERFRVNDTLNFIPVAYDPKDNFFYDALVDPELRGVTFRQRNVEPPSRVNWISRENATARYRSDFLVGQPGGDLYEIGTSGGTAADRIAFARRYSRKDGSRKYSFTPKKSDCPFPERAVGAVHESGDIFIAVNCILRDDFLDDPRNTLRIYRLSSSGSVEWSREIESVYGGAGLVALDPSGRRLFVTWSRIRRVPDGDELLAFVALYMASSGSRVAGPLQLEGIRSIGSSAAVDEEDLIVSANPGSAVSHLIRLSVERRKVRTRWAVDVALPNVRLDIPTDEDGDLLFLCGGGNGGNAVLQARELDDGALTAEEELPLRRSDFKSSPCRFIQAEADDRVAVGVHAGTLANPIDSTLVVFNLE